MAAAAPSSVTRQARRSSCSRRTPPSARATSPRSRPSSAARARRSPRCSCPLTATDLTPFAQQVKQAEPGPAVRRLGRHDRRRDVDGTRPAGRVRRHRRSSPAWLERATHAMLRPGGRQDQLPLALRLRRRRRQRGQQLARRRRCARSSQVPDIFTPDGFVAAQMIVHALEARRRRRRQDDPRARGLEVPRRRRARSRSAPQDHALLQPMFRVKLVKDGAGLRHAELRRHRSARATAPPATAVQVERRSIAVATCIAPVLATTGLGWRSAARPSSPTSHSPSRKGS